MDMTEEVKERTQLGYKELCSVIAEIDDPIFLEEFFSCLFTPAERMDIANRWLLVKEIDKGTTQREIARLFGMSLCKITRGSTELKKENSPIRVVLNKQKK